MIKGVSNTLDKNQEEKKSPNSTNGDFQEWEKANSPGARTQGESNLGQKGLRERNSPTCTLSPNGDGGNHCVCKRIKPKPSK